MLPTSTRTIGTWARLSPARLSRAWMPSPPPELLIATAVRVRGVDDRRPRVDARANAIVAGPCHYHAGTIGDQVSAQVGGDVEVEAGLGVAGVGLSARGVAGLPLPAVPDQVRDVSGMSEVTSVVAWVNAHDLARQREARRAAD